MADLLNKKILFQVHFLEAAKKSKVANVFIVALILVNTLAVILETVDSVYLSNQAFFTGLEIFSVAIFTLEYFFRLLSIIRQGRSIIKYVFSSSALIDLLAILPFYVPLAFGLDFRAIRILRLFRMLRVLKLGKYTKASITIKRVFTAKREELIVSLLLTLSLIIVASTFMYFIENRAQPDKFSSIPETMWWSVATLTTVGYGDVYPITTLGKAMAALIAILGIGMFALPAGILASGFSDTFKKNKSTTICQHCGKEICI